MASIFDLQRSLKAKGFDPGLIDGVWGRRSIGALRDFQTEEKLKPTGVLGAEEYRRLGLSWEEPVPVTPPWYAEATRLMGVRERVGAGSNPAIIEWAKRAGGWVAGFYRDDATPWCGLFVSHCVGLGLPDEPLPTNPLSALAWATFGYKLDEPRLGAVLVFKRPGGGHVGFYAGEDADAFHVLGGNQGDKVCVARVPRARLVATRWPLKAPRPSGGRVARAGTIALSRNEA